MSEVEKTRYSDEELAEFKAIILDKLEKAKADYELLRSSITHTMSNDTEDTSPTFKVLEEGAATLSKEESGRLAQRQLKFIQHLEAALVRIENKTYGICRETGKLIPKERLKIVPHATLSIEPKRATTNRRANARKPCTQLVARQEQGMENNPLFLFSSAATARHRKVSLPGCRRKQDAAFHTHTIRNASSEAVHPQGEPLCCFRISSTASPRYTNGTTSLARASRGGKRTPKLSGQSAPPPSRAETPFRSRPFASLFLRAGNGPCTATAFLSYLCRTTATGGTTIDMANNKITIYTDGAAQGNPGRGGYGVVLLSPPYRKELSEGFRLTTNNRMELLAVIKGLETLKFDGCEVTVFSDSRYVVDAVTKGWVFGWEKKGYKDKKNPDLWRRFMVLYRKHHVRFVWVKGHDGNPENERCDRLAVAAANSGDLKEDAGYTGKEER